MPGPILAIYPNPMRSGQEVHFVNPHAGDVHVELFNLTGSLVSRILVPARSHERLTFVHRPGLYFIKSVMADGSIFVDKLVVVD